MNRIPKKEMEWKLEGKRRRGRPTTRWSQSVEESPWARFAARRGPGHEQLEDIMYILVW